MKNDVIVLNKTALSDESYEMMENCATNAVMNLSSTMDKLLDIEGVPTDSNIDKSIDCAEAMMEIMAVFHKGREVQARTEEVKTSLLPVGRSNI